MKDFKKSAGLRYIGAILTLVFGLFIVLFHNVWVYGFEVIITIIGFMSLIEGTLLLIYPKKFLNLADCLDKKPQIYAYLILSFLMLGMTLIFHGYM